MKNYNGETISGIPQLKKSEFGTGKTDRFGQPIINWNHLSEYSDNHGFDTRNIEDNGKHIIKYIPESLEYNEYKVVADNLYIICIVDKGIVAPGFDSKGGAIQYLHPITLKESVKKGMLERI